MCRKLFLLVFAALLLALPAVSSASLLSNRGFEEGTWTSESSIPDDWWKWTSGGWGSWKNNAGQAHSGSKFVCVGGNNSSQYAIFGQDVFDMRAGAIYQFDAWVKTENWGSQTAKLRVEFKNSDNYVIVTDELMLFTGQKSTWEQYTFTTDIAPVGTVQANFVCYGHGQGSVWFDDTYAVPAPVAEGPDLLLNSSFEDGEWVNEFSIPDHWRKWSGNWGWAAWKNDPYEAHSGSKSFALVP